MAARARLAKLEARRYGKEACGIDRSERPGGPGVARPTVRADAGPARGSAGPVTCAVADDHPVVTELLARYLEERGLTVVGTARDGAEAVELIERTRPAVALVDVHMPYVGGVDVARRLREAGSPTAVVLYTSTGPSELLLHALEVGVRGIVQKEGPLEDVVRALSAAAAGSLWIDPQLSSVLLSAESTDRLRVLTGRQREVLELIADGLTTDEVAAALFITPDTVRVHLRNAMAILDARTRTHAIAKAIRRSLIP